ncbi:S-adenosyl-L-methionine-dependent methyltransferase [Mollisia scopiformis]|uniref:S-adenosyl-L-methionine-dependent methyltransferase n=1 Tax=Mollisia scopiformis TaxID=149040 RepID=A0A194XW82_MOLSC|nr:S-adenosyl-L-methionine-dependent methyltransferase [Mollisia scopiformis]KUJ24274.1 S-adenosyl-L-methionine-dependent methyltransferase [Mollisia scopiformis]
MSIKKLLDSVAVIGEAFTLRPTDSTRKQLVDVLGKLSAQIIPPTEQLLYLAWAEPARPAALTTALDLGLFEHMTQPISVENLSKKLPCSTDVLLLNRLLQHLAATFVISSPSPQIYEPTPLSLLLQDPRQSVALRLASLLHGPNLDALPRYLSTNGYKSPADSKDLPFHLAHETKQSPWGWGSQRPEVARAFALHMSGYHIGRPNWLNTDMYPFEERVLKDADDDHVLFLDVGGGMGDDIANLRARLGNIIGNKKLVLQERETIVARVKQSRPELEVVVGDFFEEPKIKGARAYFLHSVLHDWPDEECQKILRHLKGAMTSGYSRLLIYENVLPEQNASWKMTSLDLIMMANAGGMEKTEGLWKDLVESSGLKVNRI